MTIFSLMGATRYRGGAATASPQFTTAAIGGVGAINDTHGNVWTLTAGTVGANNVVSAQIAVNGTVDPVTGSVFKLVYQGGRIWQFTAFGWYYKVLRTDAWTPDPGPVSANAFIINLGDGTAIINSGAYVWQLTAGGQIRVDGVIDPVTNSVTQIEYFNGQVWQNTAFGWYRKSLPSDAWIPSAAAPGVVVAGTRSAALGAQLGAPENGGSQPLFDAFRQAMGQSPTLFTTYFTPPTDDIQRNPDFSPVLDGNGNTIPARADWRFLQYWSGTASSSAFGITTLNSYPGAAPITIPLAGVAMAQFFDTADQDFADIQAGKWDNRFQAGLDQYVAAGFTTIYLRPGFEMNGNWFPWSVRGDNSNAAAFAATFRHIATWAYGYASAKGISVQMVWNPGYVPGGPWPNFNTFYPGDAYVDHIGIDTYGLCSGINDTDPLLTYPGDPTHFCLDDAITMCVAAGKPLCFPEIGVGVGETNFQNNVKTKLLQNPSCKVSFVAIWDQPTGCGWPNISAEWSTNANSGAAWKAMFSAIQTTNLW